MDRYITKFIEDNKIPNIYNSEKITENNLTEIRNISKEYNLTSADADLVVFGSLARNECTGNSDMDWTLLVDAQANPQHQIICNKIRKNIESIGLKQPGISGMFGQITFSHDLIHYIGGEDDTNYNLSRRLLLLLESEKILFNNNGESKGMSAYNRVLKGILQNYIHNDSGYKSPENNKIPRFLLNDFIRFWRTMCVDFAFKQKEQDGMKWGIRNIKLRMSRKLIYIKGLLMCFDCQFSNKTKKDDVVEHLYNLSLIKPLDILIFVLEKIKIEKVKISGLIDDYDSFLGILHDQIKRDQLSTLEMKNAYEDEVFDEARKIAISFQEKLSDIFIHDDNKLRNLTLKYGIF